MNGKPPDIYTVWTKIDVNYSQFKCLFIWSHFCNYFWSRVFFPYTDCESNNIHPVNEM